MIGAGPAQPRSHQPEHVLARHEAEIGYAGREAHVASPAQLYWKDVSEPKMTQPTGLSGGSGPRTILGTDPKFALLVSTVAWTVDLERTFLVA